MAFCLKTDCLFVKKIFYFYTFLSEKKTNLIWMRKITRSSKIELEIYFLNQEGV